MKKLKYLLAGTLVALPILTVQAAPEAAKAIEIGKKNTCFACHASDHALVGPAYQEVSKRYQGDTQAASRLVEKIRTGGAGNWGQVAMPANTSISDTDLNHIVEWILAGAQQP